MLHYKYLQLNHLPWRETKGILEDSNSAMIKKSKLSDSMMALCSHFHFDICVKPSAMSRTVQLSTFIKRLQTPPHTHWQDWGKPAGGACPLVQWSFMRTIWVSFPSFPYEQFCTKVYEEIQYKWMILCKILYTVLTLCQCRLKSQYNKVNASVSVSKPIDNEIYGQDLDF